MNVRVDCKVKAIDVEKKSGDRDLPQLIVPSGRSGKPHHVNSNLPICHTNAPISEHNLQLSRESQFPFG
jgi:hypothetical protein